MVVVLLLCPSKVELNILVEHTSHAQTGDVRLCDILLDRNVRTVEV